MQCTVHNWITEAANSATIYVSYSSLDTEMLSVFTVVATFLYSGEVCLNHLWVCINKHCMIQIEDCSKAVLMHWTIRTMQLYLNKNILITVSCRIDLQNIKQ